MTTKLQFISELSEQTAQQITDSVDGWKEYLNTAARLYKYSFDDQLLIHAQRPDATACAFMEQWNGKMNRWVKPGSKGIALIHKSNGRPRLEYVFDVSDTRPVKGAKTPWLWVMQEEYHTSVLANLEQFYGPTQGTDFGSRLMELAARAVGENYREALRDLEYDIGNSFLEGLDDLNLDVRFRNTLTASVQYTLLTRCGLDASEYLDDDDLHGITEFSTSTVLSHLGNACTSVSSSLLLEIGRTIKDFEIENLQNPLAKSNVISYIKDVENFNTLNRKRRNQDERIDIHKERGLPDSRSIDGRGGRDGGSIAGQIRDVAADIFTRTSQGDVHLDAANEPPMAAPVGNRQGRTDESGHNADRADEAEWRGRETESIRPDEVGAGSEQLEANGRGSRPEGANLQLNQKEQETVGGEPAVFASQEEHFGQIALFPTVEGQIQNIVQAQAEENQSPAFSHAQVLPVPQGVIDRVLSSGSNQWHSIERIVANFQKDRTGSAHENFLKAEYREGGKGFSIAGKEYAVWFGEDGLRIAPGRTTNVPGCTVVPWIQAAVQIQQLLREGTFATQEKLDAARPNEMRELAESLWYMRQNFSNEAGEQGYTPIISENYGGFPDSTKKIAEMLADPTQREAIISEVSDFADAYAADRDLLRWRMYQPQKILLRLETLRTEPIAYTADPNFEAKRPSFITEDEIDKLLTSGSNVSEGKMRIASYFMQGHDSAGRARFLREEYGIGSSGQLGYNSDHDSKGLTFIRDDEVSGFSGYDKVHFNWNQVEKRISALIKADRYLNASEKAYIPEYESLMVARQVAQFFSNAPKDEERTFSWDWNVDSAKLHYLPKLTDPEKAVELLAEMRQIGAFLPSDYRYQETMERALAETERYVSGDYSLFTPLAPELLQAERDKKQTKRTPSENPPLDNLAAAARALARKKPSTVKETGNGQLSLDFLSMGAAAKQESTPPLAIPSPEPDEEAAILAAHADAIEEAQALLNERGYVVESDGLFLDALEQLDENPTAEDIADTVEEILLEDEREVIRNSYDLGYGHMGNGLAVWNQLEQEDGDFKTIAHISPDRTVKYYDANLPDLIKAQIEEIAATSEMTVSATQDAPVFHTPPTSEPRTPETAPTPDLPKLSVDLFVAFQTNKMDSWQTNIPKQQRIKSALYQILKDKNETERTFNILYNNNPINAAELQKYLDLSYRVGDEVTFTFDGVTNAVTVTEITENEVYYRFADVEQEPVSMARHEFEKYLVQGQAAVLNQSHAIDTTDESPTPTKPMGEGEPTIKDIYSKWLPEVVSRVMGNEAYQNACHNSDEQNARMELYALLDKTALDIMPEDNGFYNLYTGMPTFHNRLRQEVFDKTYSVLSKAQDNLQKSPADLYHEYLPKMLDRFYSTVTYHYLRDNKPNREIGIEETKRQLNRMVGNMEDVESRDFRAAYVECALFSDWLASDIYDRAPGFWTGIWEDSPDLVTLYAHDDNMPEWVRTGIDKQPEKLPTDLQNTPDKELKSGEDSVPVLKNDQEPTGTSQTKLYRETLASLIDAVRWHSKYSYLRNEDTEYREAKNKLERDINQHMDSIAEKNPALYNAYTSLPMFREWLTDDILKFTYQVDSITDYRDAVALHADEPDVPRWAQKTEAIPAQKQPKRELPTLNADAYINLKAQHPDKIIGVHVDGMTIYYGSDAETAAHALGKKLVTREVAGLGETSITGTSNGWQSDLVKLVEKGNSVLFVGDDGSGSYETIKERTAAEYIPIGMELTIDGRRMQIDSVDFNAGTVSLRDMELAGWFPIFRSESVKFVRSFVEEQQTIVDIEPIPLEQLDTNEKQQQIITDRQEKPLEPVEIEGGRLVDIVIDLRPREVPSRSYSDINQALKAQLQSVEEHPKFTLLYEDYKTWAEYRNGDNLVGHTVVGWIDTICKMSTKELSDYLDTYTPGLMDAKKLLVSTYENRQSSKPTRQNFRITDENLGAGGQKTKYQANISAIRTLKQIEAENRLATTEEQETLSRYVGWGGIADAFDASRENWSKEYAELKDLLTPEEYQSAQGSVLNAHYTSPTVIKAMYSAVEQMGLNPGNILEPAMGVGNFFGLVPESMEKSRLYGVELDSLTGRIAKQLYQKADITISGFEKTDRRDFYDLAVGNVPFGQYKVSDKPYDKLNFPIHDYFLAKSIDQLRPGGIMAVVTSHYTLDKQNSAARQYLAKRADLLGAIRLPNNAFKQNANTEVTSDILFFQKRDHAPEKEPEWVQLGELADGITVNRYFADNPHMILGEMVTQSGQFGTEIACQPIPGEALADQLATAIKRLTSPNKELLTAEPPEAAATMAERESIPADPNVRNYSFALVDGELYFRENSRMKPVELGKTPAERVKGMLSIRDCARRLIDLQLMGAPESEIEREQARLGVQYDRFTKSYGLLNSLGNKQAFESDSSYPLLCSLEILDEEGKLERKADMFTKRTIQRHSPVTSVDTAVEALAVSIGEKACVDLGYMASLMGGSDKLDTIIKDLHGVIFKDPTSDQSDPYTGWQTADEYLSGNVRQKLEVARAAAEIAPEYAINVEKLEQVQPKELSAAEIDVRIGATWIEPKYYKRFMFELLQTPKHLQSDKIDVRYAKVNGEWNIMGKSADSKGNARANATYGTKRRNAYMIIEDSLNLRDTRIYDTVLGDDGKEKRVLNPKETAIAQQKQEAIGEAFKDWIWKDPQRREELSKVYNEIFNSTRPREYDGQHIRYTGMNPEINLRTHQNNAVAHILYGGNTLLAHCVGAGKTFEMIAAAMESKRLGLAQKSLFVVPNHLTEQWGGDFLRLYPGANVLVATKKDFEPKNRKKFCARIATGDYDAVVIGHSQFEKIPLSPERQKAIIDAEIDEIVDAIQDAKEQDGERYTIKQLEKTKKNLEVRLEKLMDSSRKDSVVTFEELGVDRLFVDEAHFYKNLFLHTKMRNVAGIGQSEAQKSSDMFGKCRYMDELTGGKGVTFATGTPVSNSMVVRP